MITIILIFFSLLITFHILLRFVKNKLLLSKLIELIEYGWLFVAFSGVVFGIIEIGRIDNANDVKKEHVENWTLYNQSRMQLISLVELNGSSNNENEEVRWAKLLLYELERGYDNEMWQKMIFANYENFFPPHKNGVRQSGSYYLRNTPFVLKENDLNMRNMEDLKPIVRDLNIVGANWKDPYRIQSTINERPYYEVVLKELLPYIICIILALRITRIRAVKKLKE